MTAPVSSLTVSSSRRPTPIIVIGLVGFTAMIGQIILMRELIVVFNGNEISIGLAVATWLLWTAAGSALASQMWEHRGDIIRITATLEFLVGLTLPVTICSCF